MIKIPKGYRKLQNLEMVQLGDKVYSSATKRFSKVKKGDYAMHNKAERLLCVIRKNEQYS